MFILILYFTISMPEKYKRIFQQKFNINLYRLEITELKEEDMPMV